MSARAAGRPRDLAIDDAVTRVTLEHLATKGYAAMSVAAIAADAGTTRQAVYRRWASKAELAVAAIASLPEASPIEPTGDTRTDLLNELVAFHRGVLRPGGISTVGVMLQDATDPDLKTAYRDRIVAPRRDRIRSVLDAAIERGELGCGLDVDLAVAGCTGTLYALALAGEPVPDDWPERMARHLLGA